jgi:hypothetical protein
VENRNANKITGRRQSMDLLKNAARTMSIVPRIKCEAKSLFLH